MTRRALSPEQAAEVRRLYAEGGPRRWTQAALAAQLGVSETTIFFCLRPEKRDRYNAAKNATRRKRYAADPEYREKMKAAANAYNARRAEARA